MKKIITLLLTILSIPIQAQIIHEQPFPFSGSGLPRQYLGSNNEAILEIKFADNNWTKFILKPLIVVEDFDSGLMGKENERGENELSTFLQFTENQGNLPSQLSTYDIIYINFKNGHDYMQRNAYLVEDIIKWVNSEKIFTAPNVVLGQGMGGLIARYALRDMEIQEAKTPLVAWNHQTSLYISHDAPHQGANVPLAAQYLLRHVASEAVKTHLGDMDVLVTDTGLAIDTNDLRTLFEQPGTKQLLKDYVDSNFVVDNSEGKAWRNELINLGYPQQNQIRNIAISNGSHCANTQNFAPSDNLFSLTAHIKTTFLTDLLMAVVPIIRFSIGAIKPGDLKDLLGGLSRRSQFNADFYGKARPAAGSSGQVYHGSITYRNQIFLWIYGKTKNSITPRDLYAPSDGLPYDYYPGGQVELFTDPIQLSLSTKGQWTSAFVDAGADLYIEDSFDYIPTPSTLDVGSGKVHLTNNDYLAKYNTSNPPSTSGVVPFDNYTTSFNASGTNENHISFNTRNGNWLAAELKADELKDPTKQPVFDCTFMCSAEISGNKTMCSSGTYSFVSGMKYYNWSVNGTNVVTWSGNNTDTIELAQVGTNSGYVTISLDFDSDYCGNIPLTKTIWVGAPVLPLISLPPFDSIEALQKTVYGSGGWNGSALDNNYSHCTFTVPQSIIADQGITAVDWTKNTSNDHCNYDNSGILKTTLTLGALNTSADVSGYSYYPWGISINISLANSCGSFNTDTYYCWNGVNTGPPLNQNPTGKKANTANIPEESTSTLSIYPNPSKGIFNIDLSAVEGDFDTVKVYDILGALVYEGDLKSKSPNLIDLTSMSTGCYIAKISGSNENVSFQLIKQ